MICCTEYSQYASVQSQDSDTDCTIPYDPLDSESSVDSFSESSTSSVSYTEMQITEQDIEEPKPLLHKIVSKHITKCNYDTHPVKEYKTQTTTDSRPKVKPNRYRSTQRHVVNCTPTTANSRAMQIYVANQTKQPKKKWIYDIIAGSREQDAIIFQNKDFILLPDTDAVNTSEVWNWLAVFTDTSLKTLRCLRQEHIKMLETCRDVGTKKLAAASGYAETQIMCYFHYLPSVYQLHLHFCAPYGQYTTADACKIHCIDNVISNLQIDSEYYKKAVITTVVTGNGDLLMVFDNK